MPIGLLNVRDEREVAIRASCRRLFNLILFTIIHPDFPHLLSLILFSLRSDQWIHVAYSNSSSVSKVRREKSGRNMIRAKSRRLINKLQSMLTYNGCGTVDTENGSPADSLLSVEGELAEEVGDSPGTSRDTEEEATLSDEFYSHDTDEEEEQGKKRRDRNNSVSKILIIDLNNRSSFDYVAKWPISQVCEINRDLIVCTI